MQRKTLQVFKRAKMCEDRCQKDAGVTQTHIKTLRTTEHTEQLVNAYWELSVKSVVLGCELYKTIEDYDVDVVVGLL